VPGAWRVWYLGKGRVGNYLIVRRIDNERVQTGTENDGSFRAVIAQLLERVAHLLLVDRAMLNKCGFAVHFNIEQGTARSTTRSTFPSSLTRLRRAVRWAVCAYQPSRRA